MSVSDFHAATAEPALKERAGHRLALLTLAATLVLIVFGGLVTNTGAGHNMVLYPWLRLVGGIFTHQAAASLILGLVVLLAIRAFHAQARTPVEGVAALRPATEMTR